MKHDRRFVIYMPVKYLIIIKKMEFLLLKKKYVAGAFAAYLFLVEKNQAVMIPPLPEVFMVFT